MSETTTEKTVAPKQLLALIKDADQKKTRIQSITGELGERVKAAVENGHLNKKAFGLVVGLHRQDEMKRNDNIRAIRLYLDICEDKLWQSEGHTGDLAEDASKAAEKAEADQVALNTKALNGGIKRLRTEEEIAAEKAEFAAQRAADAVVFDGPDAAFAAALARGRADFLAGKPGMVPDDLRGTPEQEGWLQGWDDESVASAKRHDEAEAAKKGSRSRKTAALAGADASGSYTVQ